MQETLVQSLGQEDPLQKGQAPHSSILAWRVPWPVESMGSQRVGHDWAAFTSPPPPEERSWPRPGLREDVSPNRNSIPVSPAPGPHCSLDQPCFPAGVARSAPSLMFSRLLGLLYSAHSLPRSARHSSFLKNAGWFFRIMSLRLGLTDISSWLGSDCAYWGKLF